MGLLYAYGGVFTMKVGNCPYLRLISKYLWGFCPIYGIKKPDPLSRKRTELLSEKCYEETITDRVIIPRWVAQALKSPTGATTPIRPHCLLWTVQGTSDNYYTTPLTALFKGFFHWTLCFEPKVAVAASLAKVKQIASALSGLGKPRLRISSLLSIFILPLDVN